MFCGRLYCSTDAETTALARVARTIECYESVTGLVDISLADGWMVMYVNEVRQTVGVPRGESRRSCSGQHRGRAWECQFTLSLIANVMPAIPASRPLIAFYSAHSLRVRQCRDACTGATAGLGGAVLALEPQPDGG